MALPYILLLKERKETLIRIGRITMCWRGGNLLLVIVSGEISIFLKRSARRPISRSRPFWPSCFDCSTALLHIDVIKVAENIVNTVILLSW